MAKRILVVDDEQDIVEILQFNLISEGYAVDAAYSAEEALPMLRSCHYDLLLLDVMMGEISGFGLTSILRRDPSTSDIPIILITALDSEDMTVKGLNIGADDYIAKPLSVKEVIARVKAVLRRSEKEVRQLPEPEGKLVFEGLEIDTVAKTLTVDGSPVQLTHMEFEILAFLVKGRGRVYSRAELIERLWPNGTIVLERTVDVNITRLRHKIAPYGEHIKTRIGYGYILK